MKEQSGFLALDGRGVYATAFLPDTLPASQAVVIVEPPAEEKRAAYRMLVRLARALASQGIAAIRFDLSGTGDSTLPHADTTFSTWVADALAAADELKTLAQTDKLAFVGARAGALVAAQAALTAHPAKLVFAEPVLNGADFLNELERRENIKNMTAQTAPAQERWQQGQAVDFGGIAFNPTLASELQNAALAQLLPQLTDTAFHAIRVSGSKRLPPAWNIFGDHTEIVADKPFWGQLDYYESDFVNDAVINALTK